jgi:hypothetical protein
MRARLIGSSAAMLVFLALSTVPAAACDWGCGGPVYSYGPRPIYIAPPRIYIAPPVYVYPPFFYGPRYRTRYYYGGHRGHYRDYYRGGRGHGRGHWRRW